MEIVKDDYALAREYIQQRSVPEPMSGCWIWMKSISDNGYGMVSKSINGFKFVRAHRLSLVAFNKIEPEKLQKNHYVCHRCHSKYCVNPLHLYLGTPKENSNDEFLRKNNSHSNKKKCKSGHVFSAENTHTTITESGRIRRRCRQCGLQRWRRWKAKKILLHGT